MNNPCDLTAVEARRLIGSRSLSPEELLESCIARIEQVNPSVNAVVATCYERAREEAREQTERLMNGQELSPLFGLPVGVKDLEDTAGLVTTYGSPMYRDHVPDQDELLVARLRQAGAIVVGKTATPEFGAGGNTTVNPIHGYTGNAFDPSRACGGSSGGSGVAQIGQRRESAQASDVFRRQRNSTDHGAGALEQPSRRVDQFQCPGPDGPHSWRLCPNALGHGRRPRPGSDVIPRSRR